MRYIAKLLNDNCAWCHCIASVIIYTPYSKVKFLDLLLIGDDYDDDLVFYIRICAKLVRDHTPYKRMCLLDQRFPLIIHTSLREFHMRHDCWGFLTSVYHSKSQYCYGGASFMNSSKHFFGCFSH